MIRREDLSRGPLPADAAVRGAAFQQSLCFESRTPFWQGAEQHHEDKRATHDAKASLNSYSTHHLHGPRTLPQAAWVKGNPVFLEGDSSRHLQGSRTIDRISRHTKIAIR